MYTTRKKVISTLSIFLISTTLVACDTQSDEHKQTMEKELAKPAPSAQNKVSELNIVNDMQEVSVNSTNEVVLKGQVLFQEMEGGFFGFIDENGKKYTPMGMNKANLRHGLVIELSGTLMPNMITTTQFGEVIKVNKVIVLDDSKALEPGRPNNMQQDR